MIPGQFAYHRPRTVNDVVSLLVEHGDDGRVIAGGHSLIPMMKMRLADPVHLIDLRDVAGLDGIAQSGDVITIGAMVTQAALIDSELVGGALPILRETALLIADPQVRYCGTIGGNVANGDPGNDMPAVMMALGARYVLHGPDGEREADPRSYYEAPYFTAIGPGEVLTAVRVPVPPKGTGMSYRKMKRKVGDYATAAAAAVLTLDGGRCTAASVALSNVAPTPLLVEEASNALVGASVDAAAIEYVAAAAVGASDPVSDLRGPAEFRRHMAGVMTRRALETALSRAQGG